MSMGPVGKATQQAYGAVQVQMSTQTSTPTVTHPAPAPTPGLGATGYANTCKRQRTDPSGDKSLMSLSESNIDFIVGATGCTKESARMALGQGTSCEDIVLELTQRPVHVPVVRDGDIDVIDVDLEVTTFEPALVEPQELVIERLEDAIRNTSLSISTTVQHIRQVHQPMHHTKLSCVRVLGMMCLRPKHG